ncbi:hypothetical protein [Thalassobacillus sp. CUG 92003]|uniref:hypothetical protein n=1 Tax=Thalassobacillus sp. CUG 92003 TaxID=2736641 RepID=UPI0015E64CB5|nr:hypothetical protein [Thalassobacillus sp. CUG 92003]
MSDTIRSGRERSGGYSKMFHEIFDDYHHYIGDKATLYYLFLLRYKNNEKGTEKEGKSWVGRKKIIEEFNYNFTQIKRCESILEAVDLIRIEHQPSGRGRPKHIYYVNHPYEKDVFKQHEAQYFRNLQRVVNEDPDVAKMLGKGKKPYFST